MKKFFSALTALLLSICFISCLGQEISDSANSQKEVPCVLSLQNARTISPANGISYKNVQEWKVTFKDKRDTSEKYNDIVRYVQFTEANPTYTVQLPLGEFYVIFEGTAESSTSGETASTLRIPFYGESTVTVTAEKANVSVFVAPQKKGTGSFNFTVNIRGLEQFPDSLFEAKLITYPQDETKVSLESVFDLETYRLSVTGNNIPSGFYILSIKYKGTSESPLTEPKEIFYPYHDFLVEIVDGLTTNGSVDITVSLKDSKTYYATTGETKGNGAFKSLPKNLDLLLDDINSTTISTADIIVVDEIDLRYPSYPEIDVSKVNKAGKTYNIFTISDGKTSPCYTITGAGKGDNPTIIPNVDTINLKDSSSSNGKIKIIPQEYYIFFTLNDNTSVIIESPESEVGIGILNTTYNSYYAGNPCVTVKNPSENSVVDVYLNDEFADKYPVVTNTSTVDSDTITEYYIVSSEPVSLGVTGIPAYKLAVKRDSVDVTESTLLYAGDTVVITATPADEGGVFAQDTTFAWFINGKKVECTEKSYQITFGQDDAVATNSIICLAGYNGEYATAGTTLTAVEQTALLYTKYGLGYAELEYLNNPVSQIINFDSSYISDFCIDTKTNDAYIIYADGNSNTYIEKATYAHANTDMHYVPVDYNASLSEPNLIRMGNDNKLYVKFSSISDGIVFGIVDLLPNGTGAKGDASISQYLIMNDVLSTDQIMSFCVDDAGIMYITYKDSESNILLGKFSIKEGILKQVNSITLATISSTDNTATRTYFNDISSALKVTDMHYEDGYIYLLVRDVFIDYSTPTNTVRSLGGVCKIKASDLTLVDSSNPLIGWATTKIAESTDDSGKTIYNYKHAESEGEYYFYGPQKIIAIKPKEIVIADDGASIENSTMNQKNRVVLFNLEKNAITDVKTSPTEFFIRTSGGDGIKYNPQ